MKEIDETKIKEAARKLNADAVLVTHLEGVSEKTVYHPPVYDYSVSPDSSRFGYYYNSVHQHVFTPGYVATYRYVRLENKLYATGPKSCYGRPHPRPLSRIPSTRLWRRFLKSSLRV